MRPMRPLCGMHVVIFTDPRSGSIANTVQAPISRCKLHLFISHDEPPRRIDHNQSSGYSRHHAQESSRLTTFVHSTMKQYDLIEQEVRERAVEMYGSLEYAMLPPML